MSEKQKPLGLVLVAIYSGLFGLGSLPIGCTAIFLGGVPGATGIAILGFLVCILGVLLITSAYGLWTLQSWGRDYTWWLYLASIPLGLMAIFPIFPGQQVSTANTAFQLLGICVDIAILVYLTKPEIVTLFESSERFADYVRREPR